MSAWSFAWIRPMLTGPGTIWPRRRGSINGWPRPAGCSAWTGVAAIHLNDSARSLGSRLDRHEDIGKGLIGGKGLSRVLAHPGLNGKPGILETPKSCEEDDKRNLAQARRLRTLGLKKLS